MKKIILFAFLFSLFYSALAQDIARIDTGRKPVILMHTIYDQLIPPQFGEVNFENMVHQKGKDHFLTVKLCNGQGHCNFTPEQIGKSFEELRHWVKTGEKAKPALTE